MWSVVFPTNRCQESCQQRGSSPPHRGQALLSRCEAAVGRRGKGEGKGWSRGPWSARRWKGIPGIISAGWRGGHCHTWALAAAISIRHPGLQKLFSVPVWEFTHTGESEYVLFFRKVQDQRQCCECLWRPYEWQLSLPGKHAPCARSRASAVKRGACSMSAVSTISMSFSLRRSWSFSPS